MSRSALLVIDMINDYDHPDGEHLARSAEPVVPRIAGLLERARDEEGLTVHVNDNFGNWNSQRDELVKHALGGPQRALVEPLVPESQTAFVVKARHSVFYETPLEYLLRQQEVDRIVLTGQVTEQCILYSALDAYIRHFEVAVPGDATAHIHDDLAHAALRMMELNMAAHVTGADDCVLRS